MSCRGRRWGGRVSLHPQNLQGLLPRQNLSTRQASKRFTPSYPLSNPPWVWANMTRLHSVTLGRKGQGRGPRLLFSSSRMTGCRLDTRLADGISKGFQEPSGVGTIITNHASNKARRVTSWQKRSKTNSIMFLRDSILKKNNHQADKLGFSTAYNTAFCLSSQKSGQRYLTVISFKQICTVLTSLPSKHQQTHKQKGGVRDDQTAGKD